jgi:hypothetical protein
MRNRRSERMSHAKPQRIELTVKSARQMRKKRLRQSRRASQLLAVRMTAFETR